MKEFTKPNVRNLQTEMVELLNDHGFSNVDFSIIGGRFSATEATINVSVKVRGTKTRVQTDLDTYAPIDGIDIRRVGPQGEKLVEYHTRKPQYPYIYTTVAGKRFKCSTITARSMFPGV